MKKIVDFLKRHKNFIIFIYKNIRGVARLEHSAPGRSMAVTNLREPTAISALVKFMLPTVILYSFTFQPP